MSHVSHLTIVMKNLEHLLFFTQTNNNNSVWAYMMNTHEKQLAEHALVLLSLSVAWTYVILNSVRRKSPFEWMKSYLRQRSTHGALNTVIRELKPYPTDYRNHMRMDEDTFNYLVELLRDDIRKTNTILREAISPEDRLAVCMNVTVNLINFLKSTNCSWSS